MLVPPYAQLKRLDECEPREVVVFDDSQSSRFTGVIVEENNNDKYIIIIRGKINDLPFFRYLRELPDIKVISYGKEYNILADECDMEIGSGNTNLVSGALALYNGVWLMISRRILDESRALSYWNLKTGSLVQDVMSDKCVFFRKWSLCLPQPAEAAHSSPLFSFPIPHRPPT